MEHFMIQCGAMARQEYTEKVSLEVAYSEWVNESVLLKKMSKKKKKRTDSCTKKEMHMETVEC